MIKKIKNELLLGGDSEDLELGLLNVISGDPLSGKTTLLRQLEEKVNLYLPYNRSVMYLDCITDFEECERPENLSNAPYSIKHEWYIKTALSVAKPGETIVIENPELHLHPSKQHELGKLFTKVANSGVQIIIETNSDHILSGIRIGVHGGEIKPSDVHLYHLKEEIRKGDKITKIIRPRIYRDAGIDRWVDGFFDQQEKALFILLQPHSENNNE